MEVMRFPVDPGARLPAVQIPPDLPFLVKGLQERVRWPLRYGSGHDFIKHCLRLRGPGGILVYERSSINAESGQAGRDLRVGQFGSENTSMTAILTPKQTGEETQTKERVLPASAVEEDLLDWDVAIE